MRIDTHQHFWKYNDTEYPWMTDEHAIIRRDFLPKDLQPLLEACNLQASIAVQARQQVEETEWLLQLAKDNESIAGVVGWVPLAENQAEPYLEKYSADENLLGVRHVVHDEQDPQFILGKDFNEGVARLKKYGLVYDILIFARHLAPSIQFVDQHPDQPMVLDHIAKPTIRRGNFDQEWRDHLLELGKRPNVFCKISGMATEVRDDEWDTELLLPYFETALEAFGAERLVYGSDWPVCLLKTEYERWYQTVNEFISGLSEAEQEAIWHENVRKAYRMS
jgi:L-fuconolactonase